MTVSIMSRKIDDHGATVIRLLRVLLFETQDAIVFKK